MYPLTYQSPPIACPAPLARYFKQQEITLYRKEEGDGAAGGAAGSEAVKGPL